MREEGEGVPFYLYQCEQCAATFRLLQQNENGAFISCPQCGTGTVRRLLPRSGVVYKGSGYYATDYRRRRKKTKESGDTTTSTSTAEE